jgi:hypothetical protein
MTEELPNLMKDIHINIQEDEEISMNSQKILKTARRQQLNTDRGSQQHYQNISHQGKQCQ